MINNKYKINIKISMTSGAIEVNEAKDENFIINDYFNLLLSVIFILALRKQLYKFFQPFFYMLQQFFYVM